MQNHTRFSVSGFTLFELLVAISILSMIMILIYNAFFQISNASFAVKRTLESRQELRLLMKIVLDDLQAAKHLNNYMVNRKEEKAQMVSGIIATQTDGPLNEKTTIVHFHAAIPTRFFPEVKQDYRDPELHEVGYALLFDQDLQQWVFQRREDFYVDESIKEGGREQILSEAIRVFQLSFQTQKTAGAIIGSSSTQDTWRNEWTASADCFDKKKTYDHTCLPIAIRLTMGIEEENGNIVKETMEINLLNALEVNLLLE